LPTPIQDAAPWQGERPHRGLRRFPFVTLLLVRDPRPESRPDRCGGPRDARGPEALGTLEAPVAPGLRAAACGDRCAPGLCWPCGGGARAGALFAKGDAQPGGEDGPYSWERLDQGAIWMALRTRRAGMIQGRHGLPGDPEWVAQGQAEASRAFVACEADGNRVAVAPRAQRGAPGVQGRRRVRELKALPCGGASHLEAPIRCGIRPVDPHKSRQGVV
jgi:hypothetical protein